MRDFASIVAYLSDPEIDELQAVINERRKSRARLLGDAEAQVPGSDEAPASEAGYLAEDLEQVPTRESERGPG